MRRVKVSDLLHTIGKTVSSSEHAFSFDELRAYALDHAFPSLKMSEVFFYYLDDENEQVRITNEAELKEGVRLMETEGSIFKLVISGNRQVADQDATAGVVSFDSEYSTALFVDLSRLLERWEASPDQAQMKKDMGVLLHEAGVQTALIDMMADVKEGSILHGVAAMFAEGKVQEIASVLMEKCPHVKELLENIMHALQVHMHAHTSPSTGQVALDNQTPLPPLPDDPFVVHRALEFVTGRFFIDISSLTNEQSGEVMFNCGVDGALLRPLSREARIRWIAETILKLQKANQALKDAKAKKLQEEAEKQIDTHGIMDADDVDNKPSAAFVGDVSFPDGSTIRAGDSFLKTWRLKNDGKTRWPAKSRLVCVGGDHLEIGDSFVSVPIVPPGKMIDVSVEMKAPSKPARYTGYWRLCTADGKRYGQRLWVDILVVGKPDPPAPSAPPATPTPLVKPTVVESHATPLSNEVVIPAPAATVIQRPAAPSHYSIPAPAPVVSPAPVAAPSPSRFQDQLDTLSSMGFSNTTLNLSLLEEYNGDVSLALNHLLQ
ncbi:hypothetical protein DYB32_003651 [Aphanomyces invadans]|uniref:UBA domain-containing protein n=1 Tax=Aphanomyces invadans TaxID=157072 RepID=A0A3R6YAY6_9STRA|nr:hypothetical protein DYB32_003651 [Aphanomyces invadans]